MYNSPPSCRNTSLISAIPFAAKSLTSCVIFIEQNFGPHVEQKWAVGAFGREGLVVILLGGFGAEAQVELLAPALGQAGHVPSEPGAQGGFPAR